MYDVVIIGGSYSGMAAALQLARARRTVAVVDAGQRRNRFAATAHGFLTQDGKPPAAIADEAKRQLLAYDTVTWLKGSARSVRGQYENFEVVLEGGETLRARRVILAHGISDELPDIPGLQDNWGKHVFHCPYCHGYELNQGEIGVLGVGEISMHHALMLPDWGRTTFFTNGTFTPDADQRKKLAERGTHLDTTPIKSVEERDGKLALHLADGRTAMVEGLFVASKLRLTSPIASGLGCAVDSGEIGDTIRTNEMK